MNKNQQHRLQILELLYLHRAENERTPWVNKRQLKTLGDIDFPLGVLQELGQIKRDGPNYKIMGQGVVAYEQQGEDNA